MEVFRVLGYSRQGWEVSVSGRLTVWSRGAGQQTNVLLKSMKFIQHTLSPDHAGFLLRFKVAVCEGGSQGGCGPGLSATAGWAWRDPVLAEE